MVVGMSMPYRVEDQGLALENTIQEKDRPFKVGSLSYTTGGLVVLFILLLWGDFAWSAKERTIYQVVGIQLKHFGSSDFMFGLLMTGLPSAINLLIGPIVACWSDGFRSRWGRRIPFLLLPTPFIVLSIIGLAYSPAIGSFLNSCVTGGDPLLANTLIILSFSIFWTVFEVGTIAANAVFQGLINDVVPQRVIGRFFGLFRAMGLLVAIIFNYTLIGHAETEYIPIFLGVGVLYGIGFSVMCCNVKEGTYPPPVSVSDSPGWGLGAIRRYGKDCFGHPFWLLIIGVWSLSNLAFAPINCFSIPAARGFGLSMDAYGKYTAAAFVISFVLAFPLGWLTDKFHPVRMGFVMMMIYCVASTLGYFFVVDAQSFAIFWAAHVVFSGSYMTVTAGMFMHLFPRLRYGQYASAANLVHNVLLMASAPFIGLLLDATGQHYQHVFLMSGVVAAITLLGWRFMYRRFMALGGPGGYVPPA